MNPSISWGDDPIALETGTNGRTFIRIGRALKVDVTDASLDQLRRLANVADDLVAVREARADVAAQVAAEDGVRHIGIPVQRNGSVAA
ncbi:hypothetical protein [Streptomyces sp. OR43]|uniref:hypothetical protein n=1 Tax=Streptomyces sp. or43 TaxID=2478957 RepID=UPI0011CE7B9C|nr:hypothetical protein [Streptomyces sp. or43]TXS48901.1 hypothetical protein EAO72_02805 [Streptomyces sp. or43]